MIILSKAERLRRIRERKFPKKVQVKKPDARKSPEYREFKSKQRSEYCHNPLTRPIFLANNKRHPWRQPRNFV